MEMWGKEKEVEERAYIWGTTADPTPKCGIRRNGSKISLRRKMHSVSALEGGRRKGGLGEKRNFPLDEGGVCNLVRRKWEITTKHGRMEIAICEKKK